GINANTRPSATTDAGTHAHATSQWWSISAPPDGGASVLANELSDPEMPSAMPCSCRPATCVIWLVITGRSTPLPKPDSTTTTAIITIVYVKPSTRYPAMAVTKPAIASFGSP